MAGSESDLDAKVQKKVAQVQELIQRIDRLMENENSVDRKVLLDLTRPKSPAVETLLSLFWKYPKQPALRAVVLRAVQMLIRITVKVLEASGTPYSNILGFQCFVELAGEASAKKLVQDLDFLVGAGDEVPEVSLTAFVVLCELGPERLKPELAPRIFDFLRALPGTYGPELLEIALKMHSWSGHHRQCLLEAASTHVASKALGELLLDLVNTGPRCRCLRAIKLLTGVLEMPGGESYLYTTDIHIWLEILMRELPKFRTDELDFVAYADLITTLFNRCPAARTHRRDEIVELLEELRDYDGTPPAVNGKCSEVLTSIAKFS